MKVKTESYKLKFKKKDADQVLIWLSGLVHVLAQINKQRWPALIQLDPPLEVAIPDVAEAVNIDHEEIEYAAFYTADLDALKAARRKVAAVVRLERMP